jgi:hypothetical protein
MKNVKSLSSFSNVSIQKSEMKKIVGGGLCSGYLGLMTQCREH